MSHISINTLEDRVYYAQNREDLTLESFFPDVEKGFYVDVGANDPVIDSVTKLFYEKGWHGINIEPIRDRYQLLKEQRPRDINLNVGVSDKNTNLVFHEYAADGLSTFSTEMVQDYKQLGDIAPRDAKQYVVEVKTLREVLRTAKVDKIQFLKVDVEGLEYEVLAGNDWSVHRPEVICIEANHIVKDWRPLLRAQGYKLALFDGLNEYYVDDEGNRLGRLNFVEDVVVKKNGGIRKSDYNIIVDLNTDLEKTQQALNEVQKKLQVVLTSSRQYALYQALLNENHQNHTRAVIAEKALRSPSAFGKYQLKRIHRLVLRHLTVQKTAEPYTPQEQEGLAASLDELTKATADKQLLVIGRKLGRLELNRLQRIYRITNHQSAALRLYMRCVNSIKRLRMRRATK